MAKGHAREEIIISHFVRSPKLPSNYLDLSGAEKHKAERLYDRKYLWWVTWYEYLLALDRAPDATPDVKRASTTKERRR